MKYIKEFKEIGIQDIKLVGGKNASLGEMYSKLTTQGIQIPDGFAITSQAYWYVINENNILKELQNILNELKDYTDSDRLYRISKDLRKLIENCIIPSDLQNEIIQAYENLCKKYNKKHCDVAIRSSATAEDLPTASFAGQQESFLNINNTKELLLKYKNCLSSLFTPRAIVYRIEHGFDHFKIGISVGVQKMVRSDLASAGVAFTLDTDSGFKDVVYINSSYGLGESVVLGNVNPDSFYVHKPTLERGFRPILKKTLGKKETKVIYSKTKGNLKSVKVYPNDQNRFSLSDDELIELSKMAITIENYYSKINNKLTPMDIEWAKDGLDQKIYIVQSRYETVFSQKKSENIFYQYNLKEKDQKKLNDLLITTGQAIGQKIAAGKVKVIKNIKNINEVKKGDIIVTKMTDPDWVSVMKIAGGIITDLGGRTCHAAIVSRELGIPAIIGTQNGTELIKDESYITLDCSTGEIGKIYDTKLDFELKKVSLNQLIKPKVELLINTGSVDQAFTQSFLPVDGVGLARIEFIIANSIKIHPMALIKYDEIKDKKVKKEIDLLTYPYFENKIQYFIDKLAQEAGTIAAAFYPKPVIIRTSDFKSNEYRNLIGGKYFEPQEENPMIGLRGASRYYSEIYKDAFALECAAMKKIRAQMGLTNIKIMIPFVRTTQEAQKVLELLKSYGLDDNNLEIIMMCEVPSNVILIDEFSKHFDGFSIGSNDLTQLTLAIDRDSALLAPLFDERNEAIKRMIKMAIEGAKKSNKPIGICGQAPSDYPEVTKFLLDCGINSISLNPDTVIQFLQGLKE